MELVRVLMSVAFETKPDHDHISHLEFAKVAVLIDHGLDLVVVCCESVIYLPMESREIGGKCNGLGGLGARVWKRNEIDW